MFKKFTSKLDEVVKSEAVQSKVARLQEKYDHAKDQYTSRKDRGPVNAEPLCDFDPDWAGEVSGSTTTEALAAQVETPAAKPKPPHAEPEPSATAAQPTAEKSDNLFSFSASLEEPATEVASKTQEPTEATAAPARAKEEAFGGFFGEVSSQPKAKPETQSKPAAAPTAAGVPLFLAVDPTSIYSQTPFPAAASDDTQLYWFPYTQLPRPPLVQRHPPHRPFLGTSTYPGPSPRCHPGGTLMLSKRSPRSIVSQPASPLSGHGRSSTLIST